MSVRIPRFDLPDLRLVVALADSGSLGKAAAALPLALSAASSRLRLLEQRLGVALFARGSQGMAPTPAGRLFIEHARRLTHQAAEAQGAMERLGEAGRTALRVHANVTGAGSVLPALLGRFLADWPQVDLELHEGSSREAMQALLEGRAELAVIDGHYAHPALSLLPFRRDRLVLALLPDHAWAGREAAGFAELAGQALVLPPAGSSLRGFLERMAGLLRVPLRVRAEAPGFGVLGHWVAAGLGLAILPEGAWRQLPEGLARLPLADAWAVRELMLAVPAEADLSAPAAELLRFLASAGPGG